MYFGRVKATCLCSYCCNRHLCCDGGRLGRVKIVTLRVGARANERKEFQLLSQCASFTIFAFFLLSYFLIIIIRFCKLVQSLAK